MSSIFSKLGINCVNWMWESISFLNLHCCKCRWTFFVQSSQLNLSNCNFSKLPTYGLLVWTCRQQNFDQFLLSYIIHLIDCSYYLLKILGFLDSYLNLQLKSFFPNLVAATYLTSNLLSFIISLKSS